MGGHGSQLRGCIIVTSAALAFGLAPASARAATTFGADLSNTPMVSPFIYSYAPVVDPGGLPNTGAPISGVLVSVRIKTTGAAGTGTIRVLQQTSHPDATTFQFLNTAPEISVPFTADADPGGHVTQVLTRRPITAGDKLGWYLNDVGTLTKTNYNDPTAECSYTGTAHMVGTTQTYSTVACNMNIVLESGTIEADADGDSFGDETQDACPTNASTQGTCPPPVTLPHKKKCKKKKKKPGASAAKKKCKKKGRK